MNQRFKRAVSLLTTVIMSASFLVSPAIFPSSGLNVSAAPGGDYRNVALHRAAYHSSAANYNDTGHLVTDGIVSNGGSITVSDQFGNSPAAEKPEMAFDGLASTKWLTFTNTSPARAAWLQVKLPASGVKAVHAYALISANDAPPRDPRDWELQGSNNGADWTVLDTRSGQTWNNERLAEKTYTLGTPASYVYYRLNIKNNNGDSGSNAASSTPSEWPRIQLGEFDLLGADGKTILRTGTDNFVSMWKSKGGVNEWIYVDLGAVSTVDKVQLFWMDDSYATKYDVQVSDDAASWTTVSAKTNGAGGTETVAFPAASARYVRLLLRSSSGSSFILSEMEVYGTNDLAYTLPPLPAETADGSQYLTGGNWRVERVSETAGATGAALSQAGYDDAKWLPATVPGTVLTSYLKAGAIPDPNVGDNQLQISDSYFTADYWYRNHFAVPASKSGQKVWLNFDAINWKAEVWFNGQRLGKIEGGFIRGKFDVTQYVNWGGENYLAVYIQKNATPGAVTEQTKLRKPDGSGGADKNGGVLGYDNPTIHASVGWDWVPTIRGRNIGIYGDVFLSYTGGVSLIDPYTVIDFNNANINAAKTTVSTAAVTVKGTVKNHAATAQTITVSGTVEPGALPFTTTLSGVAAGAEASFSIPVTIANAKLWWPNTYGDQPLYTAKVEAKIGGAASDVKSFSFGVRKFTYENTGTASAPVLRILCNGARVMGRGGNWGMDDSNLAATPDDYDVKVRLHAEAGFTMIRNWVGMTNNKAFYDACDKHGIMVFDDFWLANPGDHGGTGGSQNAPADMDMFEANAVDKVQKLRGRTCIVIWCGRNEGMPPDRLNAFFKSIVGGAGQAVSGSMDNTRWYIPHSADNGNFAEQSGVSGWGPYGLQDPKAYFDRGTNKLHSELGLPNIPSYESMLEMLTPEYAWPINSVWGLHDYCDGSAQAADQWDAKLARWYGAPSNLKDFTRKSQMMNYENHKAIFENDANDRSGGTLMWMSQSAWPSMVWQTYDYYYDTNGGYFGIKKGNQPINAFWVNGTDRIMLCNNTLLAANNLTVKLTVYDLNGQELHSASKTVSAGADTVQLVHNLPALPGATDVRYIKLEVLDSAGSPVADNFYWYNARQYQSLHDLDTLAAANITMSAPQKLADAANGNPRYAVTLTNGTDIPALMVRLRTLDAEGNRMLPVYYSDNYVSLMPGDAKTITLEIDSRYATGDPTFAIDGWNTEEKQVTYTRPRSGFSYVYPQRYNDWTEGMLTGNGVMGAIVFGDPYTETVIFNHKLFNKAATTSRPSRTFNDMTNHPVTYQGKTYTNLAAAIQEACAAENWALANYLANQNGWVDGGEGSKHPGYKMNITVPRGGEVQNYVRSNDFTTGEVFVNWTDDRGDWERKTFVSREDNVIVEYIPKPSDDLLNCAISIGTDPDMGFWNNMTFVQNNALTGGSTTEAWLNMRVTYPDTGGKAGYEGVTRAVAQGGTLELDGNVLNVRDADAVILITRLEKYYDNCAAEWNKGLIKADLQTLSTDYDALLQGQIDTHGEIYNRVALDLGASEADRAQSNEALLARQKNTDTPILALYERLFDAGRYHYLCSAGDLGGPDLLGIWTGNCSAGWGGTYHLDVNFNIQMTQAITGNMTETMAGYVYLNEAWAAGFAENAEKLLGVRGLLAGGNCPNATSGLISTITSDFYPYQYVTGEMAWLLQPIWQHYEVTGDKAYLEEHFYPLIREMGDFYEDFLKYKDANGNYILAGSISPEAQPSGVPYSAVNNSTFDIAGAKFCLEKLLETCKILNKDAGSLAKWQELLDHLPPYLVDKNGGLSEWSWPSLQDCEAYGHRHASHLLPAYFLREITPHKGDKALYEAAYKAIELKDRYDLGGNGHGLIHTALNAAMLQNVSATMNRLQQLSNTDMYFTNLATRHDWGTKTNGVSQYQFGDGTFCTDTANAWPAVILEMLMYNDENMIELLPTMPREFQNGSVTRLLARGGFEVSMAWESGVLRTAEITSLGGNTLTLAHTNFSQVTVTNQTTGQPVAYTRTAQNEIRFDTAEGVTYLISGLREDPPVSDPREFLRATADNLYAGRILEQTRVPAEVGDNGAYIEAFLDGSMASALGMRVYDVITNVNGERITNTEKLLTVYGGIPDGQKVSMTVWRENRYLLITFVKGASNSYMSMPGKLEAEAYSDYQGTTLNKQNSGTGQCIGSINNGDWVRYDNVCFSTPLATVYASAAKDAGSMQISVRLDSPNATPVAVLSIQPTGGWHTYQDFTAPITGTIPEGVHTVYLTFNTSVNLDFFGMDIANPPDAPAGLTVTNATSPTSANGAISGVSSSMRYRAAESSTYTDCTGTTISGLLPGTYYVSYKAAGSTQSAIETIVVVGIGGAGLPDAPAGLTAVKASSSTAADGGISGVTDAMEYRAASGSTYIACTGNTISGLLPGDYYVRYKAAGTTPASAEAKVTVGVETAGTYKLGDVNGDTKVDSTDARMVLQHEVKLITLNDTQKKAADVNVDTKIDSTDARMILQYEVKLINW